MFGSTTYSPTHLIDGEYEIKLNVNVSSIVKTELTVDVTMGALNNFSLCKGQKFSLGSGNGYDQTKSFTKYVSNSLFSDMFFVVQKMNVLSIDGNSYNLTFSDFENRATYYNNYKPNLEPIEYKGIVVGHGNTIVISMKNTITLTPKNIELACYNKEGDSMGKSGGSAVELPFDEYLNKAEKKIPQTYTGVLGHKETDLIVPEFYIGEKDVRFPLQKGATATQYNANGVVEKVYEYQGNGLWNVTIDNATIK